MCVNGGARVFVDSVSSRRVMIGYWYQEYDLLRSVAKYYGLA